MKTTKLIALLLAVMTVLMLCVACANNSGDKETTTTADPSAGTTAPDDSADTEPEETTAGLSVPEDLNFNKDFTIFTWSNQTLWEWDSDKISGELIDDAIYERRMHTEERLGVRLQFEKTPGEWENRNPFIQKLAASVLSGTKAYDLVGQYTPCAAIGAMQKLYLDLNDVEHLDLNKPWWPGDITESSSINGKLYFTTGDITPTLIRNMSTVMVNTDLAESLGIDGLYDLVDSGKWTLEKLKELALGQLGNLNDGDAYYGVTISNNVIYDSLFYSGGFKFVDANSDGTISLSDTIGGEKIVNWFKSCQSLLNDNADVELLAINKAFTDGRSIFHMGQTSDIQNYLKDVSFDFAILPFPKYDEAQEEYHTIDGYWVSMYSIPIDVQDTAMSGAVLEVLGYEAYLTITPAFYEDAFQYRYLATEANARMFDLLHDTLTFDTGRTFCDQINCFSSFRKAADPATEWTSFYNSNKKIWDKAITKIYNTIG